MDADQSDWLSSTQVSNWALGVTMKHLTGARQWQVASCRLPVARCSLSVAG